MPQASTSHVVASLAHNPRPSGFPLSRFSGIMGHEHKVPRVDGASIRASAERARALNGIVVVTEKALAKAP